MRSPLAAIEKMKCKPKIRPRVVFANQENYLIVAIRARFYENAEVDHQLLLLNDDCLLQYEYSKDFEIVDGNESDFVKIDLKNDSINLSIDPDFINIFDKSLEKNDNLEFNTEIWDLTWLSKAILQKGLAVSEFLEKINLDDSAKMRMIDGFLLFANDYILFNKDSDGWDEIFFHSVLKEKSRLRFENDKFVQISMDNYEENMIALLSDWLFNGKVIKNFDGIISEKLVRKLFLLIDCIFVDGIDNLYSYSEGWTGTTIIEYKTKYYLLGISHSS